MSKQGFRVSAGAIALVLLVSTAGPGHAAPRAVAAPESVAQGVWARIVESLEGGVARILGVRAGSSATPGTAVPGRMSTQSGSGTNSGITIDPNG
jgi:hypothetical protein